MRRFSLVVFLFLVLPACLSFSEEQARPIKLSFIPQADIPIFDDKGLFQLGGGASISGSYVFPFKPYFSVGVEVDYHFGQLRQGDLGNPGSLSTISAECVTELRIPIINVLDIYAGGGAGYFYTFINDDPTESGSNMAWHARLGVGYRITTQTCLSVTAEYRSFEGFYNIIGAGLGIDIWFGEEQ